MAYWSSSCPMASASSTSPSFSTSMTRRSSSTSWSVESLMSSRNRHRHFALLLVAPDEDVVAHRRPGQPIDQRLDQGVHVELVPVLLAEVAPDAIRAQSLELSPDEQHLAPVALQRRRPRSPGPPDVAAVRARCTSGCRWSPTSWSHSWYVKRSQSPSYTSSASSSSSNSSDLAGAVLSCLLLEGDLEAFDHLARVESCPARRWAVPGTARPTTAASPPPLPAATRA